MSGLRENEIQIGEYVYDLKAFAPNHPGGAEFVAMFGGLDATAAYYSYHNHPSLSKKLEKYRIRKAQPAHEEGYLNSPAFNRLKAKVYKAIPNTAANTLTWVRCISLITAIVLVECYMLVNGRSLFFSMVLGVLCALIGLNIQHDANHGAFSKIPIINRTLGYMQDIIGGSALLWRMQHDVLHHVLTNHRSRDPDHDALPFIQFALGETNRNPAWVRYQHYYALPMLCFLPVNWCFLSLLNLLGMNYYTLKISSLNTDERNISLGLRAFFLGRMVLLPLLMAPTLYTVLCVCTVFATAGFCLGVLFIVSHNFIGVAEYQGSTSPTGLEGKPLNMPKGVPAKLDWAAAQVVTSATWGGAVAGFLVGGLNFQIEHHLFPRICSCHYPKLAPIVKEWCKEEGIPYPYFPTFYSNLESCLTYLRDCGAPARG